MIPTTMKAVYLTGHGGYEKLSYREDVPVPVPGEGEVLIRVSASAVNNSDINLRLDWYSQDPEADAARSPEEERAAGLWEGGEALRFPKIQGVDVCGRIAAVGPGVNADRIGERVLIEPTLRNPTSYFGVDWDGGFAQYCKAPSVNVHEIRSTLSDIELASFPCSYSTAENMLTRSAVIAGDRVLVTGASGGVGSAAVQLAKARGAVVTAVAGSAKADQLLAVGADRVVDRNDPLIDVLGKAAVDVVIDLVGGPAWPALLEVLAHGGRYACSGAIAGALVSLDLRTLYFKDLTFFGCTTFEPPVFRNLMDLIEASRIKPLVADTYPLSRIADAQRAFVTKTHVGKIVLTIED